MAQCHTLIVLMLELLFLMYEKKALGIQDDKARIHKETIANSKQNQNERVAMMNKPIFDTKPVTQDMFKKIEQSFINAIKNQQNLQSVTLTGNKSKSDVEFIPILTAASSHASNNQAIKKPLSKKNKKETEVQDEYFIDENKDVDLMLYWELQKELNLHHALLHELNKRIKKAIKNRQLFLSHAHG